MTHFLDTAPFDYSRPEAQELIGLLSMHYWSQKPVVQLVQKAGMSPAYIAWDGPMDQVWFDLVGKARSHAKLRAVLAAVIADPGAASLKKRLEELFEADPPVEAPVPPDQGPPEQWTGFEKVLGRVNTLLDIAFLKQGLHVGTAVCRATAWMPGGRGHGTAFRIGPDLLLTNHHVLFDWRNGDAPASRVRLWFDYERQFGGGEREVTEIEAVPESIIGEKKFDWAIVRTAEPLPERFATLSLGSSRPVEEDDRIYIIQHPDGGPKLIGMHNNVVRHVDETVVQYRADTKGGSSGSPVCNDRWEVVGLHHRWARGTSPTGGQEFRNQGIRIERVLEGFERQGVSLGGS